MERLGIRIKERRKRIGLSQKQLAERAEVSRAMLSDIERGVKNPTIRILSQIAGALECTISLLIGEKRSPAHHVTRRHERQIMIDAGSGAERHILSPMAAEEGTDILIYELPPRSTLGPMAPRFSDALIHVTLLSGGLICDIDNHRVELAEGDSVTFHGRVTREFINVEDRPCRFFMVVNIQRRSPAIQ